MKRKPPKKDKFTTLKEVVIAVAFIAIFFSAVHSLIAISKQELSNFQFFGLVVLVLFFVFQTQSIIVRVLKMQNFYNEVNDMAFDAMRKFLNFLRNFFR